MEFVAGKFSSIYRADLASSWGTDITKLMPISTVDRMGSRGDARGVRCEGSSTAVCPPGTADAAARTGCSDVSIQLAACLAVVGA